MVRKEFQRGRIEIKTESQADRLKIKENHKRDKGILHGHVGITGNVVQVAYGITGDLRG